MARGTWGGSGDPSIFAVRIRFFQGTQRCQSGFKLRDALLQDQTAQEVADQVLTVLRDPFRMLIRSTDSVEGVDVVKLGSEEGGWAPTSGAAGTSGGAATDMAPDYTCVNLTFKSEVRKRYGQGRMFLPIAGEGAIDHNALNATGVNIYNTFLAAMTDNFTGSTATHDLILVTAHGVLPPRPPTASTPARPEIPASWYDVVTLRINPLVTMLRSRKADVGS